MINDDYGTTIKCPSGALRKIYFAMYGILNTCNGDYIQGVKGRGKMDQDWLQLSLVRVYWFYLEE